MKNRIEVGGHRGSGERVSVTTWVQRLPNGKFEGVVTRLYIRGSVNDEIEIHCKIERDTEEEALKDAKVLAEKD